MLEKLDLLLSLARERHFGRAAEAAGVTQPTSSSAVKSLEEQFGVLIVIRGSRFQGFTPEGEKILEWVRPARPLRRPAALRGTVLAARRARRPAQGLAAHISAGGEGLSALALRALDWRG